MKLFFFPHAGASSATFLKWRKYLDEIEIFAIDLPGRGTRISEPLCETIEAMVEDIKKQVLLTVASREEYAFYGHSMGALLIYELLHNLLGSGFHMPVHVFLSGKNPPHIIPQNTIYNLNEPEFIEQMVFMGGMDENFFKNPLLKKMYLPVFRTDLRIVETYCFITKNHQLPVDVSYFYASDDSCLKKEYVKQWANYITGFFRMHIVTGGHFFFFEKEKEEQICNIIIETLSDTYDTIPY